MGVGAIWGQGWERMRINLFAQLGSGTSGTPNRTGDMS